MRRVPFCPVSLACLALSLAATCGCSSIPAGRAPGPVPGLGAAPMPYRVSVAPVTIHLAAEEEAKGYKADEVVQGAALRDELVRWVGASSLFTSARAAAGDAPAQVLREAYEAGDELLVEVSLGAVRTRFDGHNGWWVPNILNWFFWIVPSWFVATEEYSLAFEAAVVVRSVDSQRVLQELVLPIEVQGTFDEFDRGWQVLGFISPSNDAENWRLIAGNLLPAARAELGEAVTRALDEQLRERMDRPDVPDLMRKTLALVVGASHYQDPVMYPPLPSAGEDARALAQALADTGVGCGVPAHHIVTLLGSDATRPAVTEALRVLGTRANAGDQLLVYIAGYGTRGPDGTPALLLHDAGAGAAGALTTLELAALVAPVVGEKLLIIDSGFDGQGRSVASGNPAPRDLSSDASALAEAAGATVIMATSPGGDVAVPEHLASSLFGHHLVRALSGAGDLDGDGRVSPRELFAGVSDRTVSEAAFFGLSQRPAAAGLDSSFVLDARIAGGAPLLAPP